MGPRHPRDALHGGIILRPVGETLADPAVDVVFDLYHRFHARAGVRVGQQAAQMRRMTTNAAARFVVFIRSIFPKSWWGYDREC